MAKKKILQKRVSNILPKNITDSAESTMRLGARFGKALEPGDVVFLKGGLGTGKTTFVKGVAKGWGIKSIVRSSSFVLVSEYKGNKSKLYHIDLYRLKGNRDFENLGLEEFLYGDGICFVEWADRLDDIPLSRGYLVEFKWLGENKRQIIIKKRETELRK